MVVWKRYDRQTWLEGGPPITIYLGNPLVALQSEGYFVAYKEAEKERTIFWLWHEDDYERDILIIREWAGENGWPTPKGG